VDGFCVNHRGAASNKPLKLTVPPQGNRSIIEKPDACGGPAA